MPTAIPDDRLAQALDATGDLDLARAAGQPAQLPDKLAEEELTFARSDAAPDVGRTGHPFGPALRIAEDARAIDRLAAFLGRAVTTDRAEAKRG